MKNLIYILFTLTLSQLLSCSAGLLNSPTQLYGSWVSQLYSPGRFTYQDELNLEFIFKEDSFFVEIIRIDNNSEKNYFTFKAKGIYDIVGDRIKCNGVYKPERGDKFNYPYKDQFEYSYNSDKLTLRSLSNPYNRIYTLVKRYPDGH